MISSKKSMVVSFKKSSYINHAWIPIKAHYFAMYGALAGVSPFLTVIGKDLGLSATAVGITFTILPICIFIFKPLIGFLSDYLQNTKTIVICLLTAMVGLDLCIAFVKPIDKNEYRRLETRIRCNKSDEISYFDFNEVCVEKLLSIEKVKCNIATENSSLGYTERINENIFQFEASLRCRDTYIQGSSKENEVLGNITSPNCILYFESLTAMKHCEKNYLLNSVTLKCGRHLETCFISNNETKFYHTYQFWIFTLFTVMGLCCKVTSATLTDIACYEILGDQREYYGQQRLWGTASTGILTLLVGYLNDLIAKSEGKNGYMSGFCIMLFLYIIDMMILFSVSMPKVHMSNNIMSDVLSLCKKKEFIVYGHAVFFVGMFTSLSANYLFWYLKDLGANQTLLGTSIAVQCLVAEIPFFFFAGWIIKHVGYFNCLTCTFISFALRFGFYSILKDPLWVLPIEVLHGVTYAVFYASKTSFVSVYAPPGTEASVLGILGGLCDGLGCAVGSFFGGLGFSRIRGSWTFFTASVLSFICIPVTFIAQYIFKEHLNTKRSKKFKKLIMTDEEKDCLLN